MCNGDIMRIFRALFFLETLQSQYPNVFRNLPAAEIDPITESINHVLLILYSNTNLPKLIRCKNMIKFPSFGAIQRLVELMGILPIDNPLISSVNLASLPEMVNKLSKAIIDDDQYSEIIPLTRLYRHFNSPD